MNVKNIVTSDYAKYSNNGKPKQISKGTTNVAFGSRITQGKELVQEIITVAQKYDEREGKSFGLQAVRDFLASIKNDGRDFLVRLYKQDGSIREEIKVPDGKSDVTFSTYVVRSNTMNALHSEKNPKDRNFACLYDLTLNWKHDRLLDRIIKFEKEIAEKARDTAANALEQQARRQSAKAGEPALLSEIASLLS